MSENQRLNFFVIIEFYFIYEYCSDASSYYSNYDNAVKPHLPTERTLTSKIKRIFQKRLRDPAAKEGHEPFYEPHTKSSFLTTRLRTFLRKRKAEIPLSSTSKNFLNEQAKNLVPTEQEVQEIKAAIVFMRHANNNQIDEIQEKLKLTFQYRRKNGCSIEKYPRLIDIKGMISYEFSLIQPDRENVLLDKFPLYLENIFKVYHLTLKNPTLDMSSDNECDSQIPAGSEGTADVEEVSEVYFIDNDTPNLEASNDHEDDDELLVYEGTIEKFNHDEFDIESLVAPSRSSSPHLATTTATPKASQKRKRENNA
ncbi:hypothetical protein FQR65_LT15490 [Abscondita terminalis]|nr:hypothetical protein FQR65_LT15490 [Abscondita terminalis]